MLVLDKSLFWEFEFSNSILTHFLIFKNRVPTRIFLFCIFLFLKSQVPTWTSFWIQCSCWTNHYFENSSFQTQFSLNFLIFKNRVPTRIFLLYILIFEISSSDLNFLLNPMLVLDKSLFWEFEFSNSILTHFLIFKNRVPTRIFLFHIFLFFWSLEFRLELPLNPTLVLDKSLFWEFEFSNSILTQFSYI